MVRLSLCMIVKNEERFLPDFITAHQGFFDEWVIVDTGSTDRTKQIIQEAGLPVHELTWQNDFAAARNHALSLCTGDWIAAFDADERLDKEGQTQIRHFIEREDLDALSIPINNYVVENDDFATKRDALVSYIPPNGSYQKLQPGKEDYGYVETMLVRFFRRRPNYRWESPVHEVLQLPNARTAHLSGVCLHHVGPLFIEEKREQKEQLYRDISKEMHQELSEQETCPKKLYEAARFVDCQDTKLTLLARAHAHAPRDVNILKEMANTHAGLNDINRALHCCEQMIKTAPDNLEGYLAMAHCLWSTGKPLDAFTKLKKELRRFREKPMYYHTLAMLALQIKEYAAARSYAKRAYHLAPSSPTIQKLHEKIEALVQ